MTLFALGTLVFTPPVIGLVDKSALVFGVPLAYVILFGVWGALILGIWLGARPSPLRGDLNATLSDDARQPTFDEVDGGSPLTTRKRG